MNSTKQFALVGHVRRDTLTFNGLLFAFFFLVNTFAHEGIIVHKATGSLCASPAAGKLLGSVCQPSGG